jgi:hypothetical protein
MNKDLPSYIFSHLLNDPDNSKNNDNQKYVSFYTKEKKNDNQKYVSFYTKEKKNDLDKTVEQNFKYLVNLDLDLNDTNRDKIKCLTQNLYFGDCISPLTRLLPYNLPELS